MRRLLTILIGAAAMYAALGTAQAKKNDLPDWQDPQVVEKNRLPMAASFHTGGLKMSLNGTWKFAWYETIDSRSMDFFKTDYADADWGEMPVPGMWELNGYGDPVYKNVGWHGADTMSTILLTLRWSTTMQASIEGPLCLEKSGTVRIYSSASVLRLQT